MNVKYFGTTLTEKGHFLQDLLSIGLDYNKSLNVNQFPFDIQSLTKGKPKGYVLKTVVDKYKIIAIEGSCCDQRFGTSSVFVTTENVTLDQFELYLLLHPWVNKMIDLMPFEVDLKTKTFSSEKEIINHFPEELLEWLKESYKSVSFGREPIKISKYGGSFFVKFSEKETYKISLQLYKSEVTID